MTTLTNSTVGVYFEWLRLQGGMTEMVGKWFRPWEQYALDDDDVLVGFKRANEDGTVVVVIQDGGKNNDDVGEEITVDPTRLSLWCIPALDK
jgi:hypothetical protein